MQPVHVLILALIASIALFTTTSGNQISLDASRISRANNHEHAELLSRQKRQLESFDNENLDSPSDQEEEPSFWDRVVKVALKLFNRFVEWLNSS